MRRAREDGFKRLSLSVEPENPSIALYEKFGFARSGSGTARPRWSPTWRTRSQTLGAVRSRPACANTSRSGASAASGAPARSRSRGGRSRRSSGPAPIACPIRSTMPFDSPSGRPASRVAKLLSSSGCVRGSSRVGSVPWTPEADDDRRRSVVRSADSAPAVEGSRFRVGEDERARAASDGEKSRCAITSPSSLEHGWSRGSGSISRGRLLHAVCRRRRRLGGHVHRREEVREEADVSDATPRELRRPAAACARNGGAPVAGRAFGPGGGEHRARVVEDDQHLRVGAHAPFALLRERRLRGREAEQRERTGERERPATAAPRAREPENAAETLPAAPASATASGTSPTRPARRRRRRKLDRHQ